MLRLEESGVPGLQQAASGRTGGPVEASQIELDSSQAILKATQRVPLRLGPSESAPGRTTQKGFAAHQKTVRGVFAVHLQTNLNLIIPAIAAAVQGGTGCPCQPKSRI